MIVVGGKEFITLNDEIFVGGKKVLEVYAGNRLVYPLGGDFFIALDTSGSMQSYINRCLNGINNVLAKLNATAKILLFKDFEWDSATDWMLLQSDKKGKWLDEANTISHSGGGPNAWESYTFAWFLAWYYNYPEKNIIVIADEGINPILYARHLNAALNIRLTKDIETNFLYNNLKKKHYNMYIMHLMGGYNQQTFSDVVGLANTYTVQPLGKFEEILEKILKKNKYNS